MSKTRREIEQVVEVLDDVPVSDDEAKDTVRRLGINTSVWAASIRAKVKAADDADRQARFAEARRSYQTDLKRLGSQKAEPIRSIEEHRAVFDALLARAPRELVASMHFHKFEQATTEDLAEAIKSLRHLLGEDE